MTIEADLVIMTKSKHELQAVANQVYLQKKITWKYHLNCSKYFLAVRAKIDLARKKKKTEYISEFKYLSNIQGKKETVILKLNTPKIMNSSIIKEVF